MKNYIPLLIVLGFFVVSSCTTTKPLTSNVEPSEVTDLQYLGPVSYISLIESGNRAMYNDTISRDSEQLLANVVGNLGTKIPVTGQISVSDTSTKNKLNKEIEFLCISADRQRDIANLKITPIIDSLIKIKGKRFGLITVATGFTRAKGNYGGEIAKGAAVGLLTLGMYVQTPIKSSSTIYVMIVDAKENNVAFFMKSVLQDKDPLDEAVLMKQFQKIFEQYYRTNE